MSVRTKPGENRRALAWYLLGFIAVQMGLAIATDACWPAVRDPDFEGLRQVVQARQAKTPGRPLILFFGSSRFAGAVRAQLLNHPDKPKAPVVVNASAQGAGPVLNDVFLTRWLDEDVRPETIFVEVTLIMLSARDGVPVEENKHGGRLCLAEVAQAWPHYAEPSRLCGRWTLARALPCNHSQAELRAALDLDLPPGGLSRYFGRRDEYGWIAAPEGLSREFMQYQLKDNLETYHSALMQPQVAAGPLEALKSILRRSGQAGIRAFLVVPPESSSFRYYCPEAAASQLAAIRRVANEFGVPLLDHRAWIGDDGFWDGHHATQAGATAYTQRFGKEVLEPLIATSPAQ